MSSQIKQQLKNLLQKSFDQSFPNSELVDVVLEKPANPAFGDFATNVCLTQAKKLGQKPREVAEAIIKNIPANNLISETSIAGPGFLNIRIKQSEWIKSLKIISDSKDLFGQTPSEKSKKVLVEFVSANPTGPLHIGHGRGAVVGDTLARLFKAVGYNVTKEYYINDGGIQMNTLGLSVLLRIKELEGETITFPENAYQGGYITDLAKKILPKKNEWKNWSEKEVIEYLGRWAGTEILEEIKVDMKNMGVEFDTYFFESELYKNNHVTQTLKDLKDNGLTYEKDDALWLASTQLGDDKDRVLIKQDKTYTYLSPDIAYHTQKFKRGYDLLVNIWGADHAGYAPRLSAAMKGLGYDESKLKVIFIQMVSLIKDGQFVAMSTRRAQYHTLADLFSEVGKDPARYFYLIRSHNAQLEFDVDLAKKQSSDNPSYYIQYAHARLCSIFSKAKEELKLDEKWDFEENFAELLVLPEETEMARFLLDYPEFLHNAALDLAPQRVAHFALDLARAFQVYYDKARNDERFRVVTSDIKQTKAKLFLAGCVRQVLRNTLSILGLEAPQKM